MLIRNNDISIRNVESADCQQLADWWNDGSVMAHAGFPNGLGTSADIIREQLSDDTDDTRRRLVIEYQDKLIGEMSYTNIGNNTAKMGIKICDPAYQNRGLGKIILSSLIKELFSRGYEKIVLDTNLKNLRAQHVYETIGFQKTRVNIDAWIDQVGVPQSLIDYELTPETFNDFS